MNAINALYRALGALLVVGLLSVDDIDGCAGPRMLQPAAADRGGPTVRTCKCGCGRPVNPYARGARLSVECGNRRYERLRAIYTAYEHGLVVPGAVGDTHVESES